MNKSVGILIKKDNKILLVQRGPKARSQVGKWECTGGAVEEGESNKEAAKREAKEELDIEIYNIKELFHTANEGFEVTIYGAETKDSPKIMIPDEISDFGWFEIQDLEKVELTTYSRKDFEKLGFINE